ncbi:MAG: flagellar protein [Planctomycetaceae bacterium]|nr:flagellar protein [Planctomycetaceae bacterium]
MIKLTRLDGEPFLLNAELIKYVEQRPDTFVTLTTGDRIVVAEEPEVVLDRVLEYRRAIRLLPDAA